MTSGLATTGGPAPGALDGIRVLDLSRVLAGPFCTQILGDLGADIIKIEKPGAGDDTRAWGPPFLKNDAGNDTSESAYYLSANRNKRSAAIDIATKEGQALIDRLLAKCDVLVENFKVGGLEKYGLSFAQVHARHPHIIYASITGFGQTGPRRHDAGYDLMAQAWAGLMAITGEPDGAPMKVGVALSDIMTGLYAATGILAALHKRKETGRGQQVDVALADCTLASLSNVAQYYLTSGAPAARQGNAHASIVPYQAFEASDGWLVVAVGNDAQFRRFANLLGETGWADDPAFATNSRTGTQPGATGRPDYRDPENPARRRADRRADRRRHPRRAGQPDRPGFRDGAGTGAGNGGRDVASGAQRPDPCRRQSAETIGNARLLSPAAAILRRRDGGNPQGYRGFVGGGDCRRLGQRGDRLTSGIRFA